MVPQTEKQHTVSQREVKNIVPHLETQVQSTTQTLGRNTKRIREKNTVPNRDIQRERERERRTQTHSTIEKDKFSQITQTPIFYPRPPKAAIFYLCIYKEEKRYLMAANKAEQCGTGCF